ncbi:hypothetical protein JTE90_003442 [Oedothorax gibbosus]|uniref:Uncharacterized protein n=1 Tax=Oedothorax gibbosus TaxID=931172 RepID=A0AAV6U004_9ARAC|nr:hypothetical protein JTE90_003442 [Oedothorax gibbosus]
MNKDSKAFEDRNETIEINYEDNTENKIPREDDDIEPRTKRKCERVVNEAMNKDNEAFEDRNEAIEINYEDNTKNKIPREDDDIEPHRN